MSQEKPVSQREPMTIEQLWELARGFQSSRVLLTAYELGVFTTLGDASCSSSEVASQIGGDPRATDRLMNALCAFGLLEKHGEQFKNTSVCAEHLVQGKPGYLSGLMHMVHLWDTWSTLTESVRRGTSLYEAPVNERAPKWLESFIAAMHANALPRASQVVKLIDLSRVQRVLDVGGGSGAYAMAFVREGAPRVRASVFDLPNVVPLTRGYIEQAGMADQVDTVVGDYTNDELPGGFDLVFLSAIIHSNSPCENEQLIAKCVRALNAGGRVVVQDFVVDEERTGPPLAVLFALNMLVGTPAGDTYTESEVRGWMDKAGMQFSERRDTDFGTTLLVARKGA